MAALDAAHAALALGLPTLLCPRMSSSDERDRHRGLSHHTASVLELLLAPVRVPVPEAELEGWPLLGDEAPEGGSAQAALDELIALCTRPPRPRGRADRPRRLRGERPAGADDGPLDRRGPAVLRRAARRRAGVGGGRRRVGTADGADLVEDRLRGPDRRRPDRRVPLRRRRDRRARDRRPPGRGRRSSPTTTSPSTSCASRARRSASRRCSSSRPASSTSRARRRSSARSASSVEEIGMTRARVERAEALLHLAGVRPRRR